MLFHYKCVHSGIRPYKCEECGMTFARQDSWKGHTHSKVRSFLCSICGKTFARRNIRDTHERAHLNDRRYPCSFCGKKFMTNQQRTNHERTHTGEKVSDCVNCQTLLLNLFSKLVAYPNFFVPALPMHWLWSSICSTTSIDNSHKDSHWWEAIFLCPLQPEIQASFFKKQSQVWWKNCS